MNDPMPDASIDDPMLDASTLDSPITDAALQQALAGYQAGSAAVLSTAKEQRRAAAEAAAVRMASAKADILADLKQPPTISIPTVSGVTSGSGKSWLPSPARIPGCTAAP